MLAGLEVQKEVKKTAKGRVWNIIIFVLLSAVAPCFLCILNFEKLSELLKTIGLMPNANALSVNVRTKEWSQFEQGHFTCVFRCDWCPNNQDGGAS